MERLLISVRSILVVAYLLQIPFYAQAQLPLRRVTVPDVSESLPAQCHPDATLGTSNLRDCLALLVKGKADNEKLEIEIRPGTHRFWGRGGILIFNRSDIKIYGRYDRPKPIIQFGYGTGPINSPSSFNYLYHPTERYFVSVIDSQNITVANLELDASNSYKAPSGLIGSRQEYGGIGICSTGGDKIRANVMDVRNVSVLDVEARGFLNWFTIVGESISHDDLVSEKSFLYDGNGNIVNVTLGMHQDLRANFINRPESDLFCSGPVQAINFHRNTIYMKAVGFYVNILMAPASRQYARLDPTYLATSTGSVHWWSAYTGFINDPLKSSRDIYVGNNRFIVDLEPSSFANTANPAGNYLTQLTGKLHSALKLSSAANVHVLGNQIDARSNRESFAKYDVTGQGGTPSAKSRAHGAALNIAAFLYKPSIQNNLIVFSPASVEAKGLEFYGGMGLHGLFGLGQFAIFRSGQTIYNVRSPSFLENPDESKELRYGGTALFGPTTGASVRSNLVYSGISQISNTCMSAKMASCYDQNGTLVCNGVPHYTGADGNPTLRVSIWAPLSHICRDINTNYASYTGLNPNVFAGNSHYFVAQPSRNPLMLATEALPDYVRTANEDFRKIYGSTPIAELFSSIDGRFFDRSASNPVVVTTTPPLFAPTWKADAAISVDPSLVSLNWNPAVHNESHIVLMRAEGVVGLSTAAQIQANAELFTPIATLSPGSIGFTERRPDPTKTYSYVLVYKRGSSISSYSDVRYIGAQE